MFSIIIIIIMIIIIIIIMCCQQVGGARLFCWIAHRSQVLPDRFSNWSMWFDSIRAFRIDSYPFLGNQGDMSTCQPVDRWCLSAEVFCKPAVRNRPSQVLDLTNCKKYYSTGEHVYPF